MIDSIPARLLARGRAHGSAPAYSVREADGTWTPTTYQQYSHQVQEVSRALVNLGFNAGDTTAILGFNRPEWVVFDVATMMAGGAPAGIYTTCSPSEVQYILHHSGSAFVLLEDENQWAKVLAERDNLPDLRHVIMMKGAAPIDHELVMSWEDFIAHGQEVDQAVIDERLTLLEADQIATFIYTSGTTGPPKAVMLSHKNLTWTADKAAKISTMEANDTSVSYLPLSHIAEQMFSIHAPITMGSSIFFAESIERVADNLKEVQPSVLFGVPRIWEKMHAKVSAKMSEATGVKAKILSWSMRVGRASSDLRNQGASPGVLFSLKHKMAHRLLFSKIKPLMGLGNARMCVTGAAPISAEILEWFAGLDVTIHEVYGQSEDCGPTSFNLIGRTRLGTVGPALEGTEVRIADDGEICVRGPHVFLGYYKDQAATDEALIDGWLHSGDLGAFDADGYLTITGRKKEIIITAGGKNIAPKNIEAALKNLPIVSQAVVIGDRRKFLSALITLDPEAVEAWAASRGLPLQDIHANPELIKTLDADIESRVNSLFARVEHVRKFTVLERDFSIDHGELTPTLKIKRRPINENWSDTIEAMYA
jgi:long-chain acyl-CoA synthetase